MVQKDHDALKKQIDLLTGSLDEIRYLLDQILHQPDKGFTVTFKDKTYDFHPATTQEESDENFTKRYSFIKKLLKHCTTRHIDQYPVPSDDIWNDILCFTLGVDPRDCQFERIKSESVYEVDCDTSVAEKITSIALDLDNYQVQQELADKLKKLKEVENVNQD
jgi:hypothetical protein